MKLKALDTEKKYKYNLDGWKDLLVEFNGEKCEYDKIGNPTLYRNNVLSWTTVRSLASFGINTFKYGADGIRIKKNDINYIFDGKRILQQYKGTESSKTEVITYYYDGSGVCGFNYGGADYYYEKNLQGDIIAITDSVGNIIANYRYDAWGKILAITGNTTIANLNPFRYRGYYYDSETQPYYLQSSYYDSEVCRFINSDDANYVVLKYSFDYNLL